MRHRMIMGIVLGLDGMSLACTPKGDHAMQSPPSTARVTPDYLLSHGFRQSATAPHIFELEQVRLGDIAHKLGFALADLRATPNQPWHSDVRIVRIKDLYFAS